MFHLTQEYFIAESKMVARNETAPGKTIENSQATACLN